MQQIINFLIKYRGWLLYLVLLSIALVFTIQSNDYHRNSWLNSSGYFSGSILNSRTKLSDYFDLIQENTRLQRENAELRMRLLSVSDTLVGSPEEMKLGDNPPFTIFPARVIKNDYSKLNNHITIDIGKDQGIEPDMGVITYRGVVGIVDETDHFTRVVSILNTKLFINAQIKGTSVIGSLNWEGEDPYTISLKDVPRMAKVSIGDTITTGTQSSTFPPDILIGTVSDIQTVDNGARYKIQVQLFNDMTDLGKVYVVKSRDFEALKVIDTLGLNE
jgi:rod shape-determining protein MreC